MTLARSNRITIFKWGYEGWGNATELLVRTVGEIERARGYKPPFFVDVRFRRSVRAKGFRDHVFEELLGPKDHLWMKSLGNAAIGDEGARGTIRIHKPEAAEELLDLAIKAAEANRRVIFFCSCGSPGDAKWCHRTTVAGLLLRAAKKRKRDIEIEEWPGGVPARKDVQHIRMDISALRKVRGGAHSVPLTDAQATTELAGLPWGSFVELQAGDEKQILSAGPLSYRAKRWQLPLFLGPVMEGVTAAEMYPDMLHARAELKIDPVQS